MNKSCNEPSNDVLNIDPETPCITMLVLFIFLFFRSWEFMDDTLPSKFQYPKCKLYWAIYNNSKAKYLRNTE